MCTLNGSKSKLKTGYKVIAKRNGKYYSTFTGFEFKTGKVIPLTTYNDNDIKRLSLNWNTDVEFMPYHAWAFYNRTFNGKTGAYVNIHEAMVLYKSISKSVLSFYDIIVVKISFRGDVFEGYYDGCNIIAGDTIRKITEIGWK